MKYTDLLPQLEEFKNLPDDLTVRLNFPPPPPLEIICDNCGHNHTLQLCWDEVEKELTSQRHKPEDDFQLIIQSCSNCSVDAEDEGED